MVGEALWIQTTQTTRRADLVRPQEEVLSLEIIDAAIKEVNALATNASTPEPEKAKYLQAKQVLTALREEVQKYNRTFSRKHLGSIPASQRQNYFTAKDRLTAQMCNPATNGSINEDPNRLGKPKRADLADPRGRNKTYGIIGETLTLLKNKLADRNTDRHEKASLRKAVAALENTLKFVKTANSGVQGSLRNLTGNQWNAYERSKDGIVAKECGYTKVYLPVIGGLNTAPGNVRQGSANVAVTVTGENFPEANDLRIEFLNGTTRVANRQYTGTNQVDPSITVVPGSIQVSADKRTLTFKINVAENAPADNPTTTDVIENHRAIRISSILYGQKGLTKASDGILRVDPKLVAPPPPPPPPPPTGRAYDVVHNRLKLQSDLLGNGGSIADASGMRAGNVPAARTSVPNFGFKLGIGDKANPVTFRGRENPVFGTPDSTDPKQPKKRFEFLGYAVGQYDSYYEKDTSHLVKFSAGAMPRLHLANPVFIDGYADYNIEYNQFPASIANRYYFNGVRNTGVFGAAIETNWGTKSFFTRLSVEGMIRGTHYNPETLGFKYFSHEQRLSLALKFTLDRSLVSDHPGSPYISAEVKATPKGRKEEPEHSVNGTIGSSFESLWGIDGNLTLRFPKLALAPSATFGISAYKQEGRRYDMEYRGAIGIDSKKAGAFTFNYFHRDNPGVYYGGEWNGYRLTYFMPNRELGFQLAADKFDRSWQFIGGLIWSLGRTIIRQPVQVPALPSDRALSDR